MSFILFILFPFSSCELTLSFRDPSEEETVENFLTEEGVEENKKSKILEIIKGMGKLAKLKFSYFFHMYLLFSCFLIEIDIVKH